MASRDEHEWKTYLANPRFERYLIACKSFDPIAIERALCLDEKSKSFDFRRVIIDAYVEDCKSGAIRV